MLDCLDCKDLHFLAFQLNQLCSQQVRIIQMIAGLRLVDNVAQLAAALLPP